MAQIFPRRVPLLDPLDFPISLPCLHSSLNNASVVNALKILEPDEPMTLIFLRETGNRPGAVLFHTPRQIVGDADRSEERRLGKRGVRTCWSRWAPAH